MRARARARATARDLWAYAAGVKLRHLTKDCYVAHSVTSILHRSDVRQCRTHRFRLRIPEPTPRGICDIARPVRMQCQWPELVIWRELFEQVHGHTKKRCAISKECWRSRCCLCLQVRPTGHCSRSHCKCKFISRRGHAPLEAHTTNPD